ncbi:hypothetical protein AbraIFM66950_002760 [Aspergillus brasiliensis]|nr:hypothetical protein AbraIFM66950_002760 [Aspergillus brasiliensis]
MATPNVRDIMEQKSRVPRLERSIKLNVVGDWGQDSRVWIWNIRHGGIEAALEVFRGEAWLATATSA